MDRTASSPEPCAGRPPSSKHLLQWGVGVLMEVAFVRLVGARATQERLPRRRASCPQQKRDPLAGTNWAFSPPARCGIVALALGPTSNSMIRHHV